MSSFVSLDAEKPSIRIGNPTFKLLLRRMKEQSARIPSIARVAEKNPIADCIGRMNFEELDETDARAFLELAKGALAETKSAPLTEAGFNLHDDLIRFVEEFEQMLST